MLSHRNCRHAKTKEIFDYSFHSLSLRAWKVPYYSPPFLRQIIQYRMIFGDLSINFWPIFLKFCKGDFLLKF